jgi:alkaline phosphatase
MRFHPRLGPTVVAAAALLGLVACARRAVEPPPPARPPNVVLLIGDGFGVGAWSLAREWARTRGEALALEEPEALGFLEVQASDGPVTDSPAASTAWSLERLGPIDRVGPADDETGRRPLLRRLREAGRASGLVTTSRITHATPAGFYGRGVLDSEEDELAVQLVDSMTEDGPDLALGGGRRHFLPRGGGGRRRDGLDLLARAESTGVAVVDELTGPLPAGRPVLGLFHDSHLPHEIDRGEETPDLAELAVAAVEWLEATGRPWFLMIEEGRIDGAAHDFDGPSVARDVRRLDRALAAVLETVDPERTLVVLGSDHATAGPHWMEWARPESLAVVTTSVERMEAAIFEGSPWRGTPASLEAKALPILDAGARQTGLSSEDLDRLLTLENRYDRRGVLGRAISRRFGIAFIPLEDKIASDAVHGHTGEPVPVRAWGRRAGEIAGVRDHAELGAWIAGVLELPPAAPPPAAPDSAGAGGDEGGESPGSPNAPIDTAGGGG